jgi:hypothetical protein
MSFNHAHFNAQQYEAFRRALKQELDIVRERQGLPAALRSLMHQQLDQGFLNDMTALQRYRITHPTDHSKDFFVQYNPRRAERNEGAGRHVAPKGVRSVNGGCYLCIENIRWQQCGLEVGYDLEANGRDYIAWMNPFPLMPVHTIVAKRQHQAQSWVDENGQVSGANVEQCLEDFLTFTAHLPGFIGLYNGDGAGASIPGHMHFQFFQRPHGQVFPLERAVAKGKTEFPQIMMEAQYPITTLYFHGERSSVISEAAEWLCQWLCFEDNDQSLSANVIATHDASNPEVFHLFLTLRNKMLSHAPGLAGMIAGLEVLGELVFTTELERQQLTTARVDYQYFERALAAVEPPRIREFLQYRDLSRGQSHIT